MTVENISWSISTKECCRPRRVLNPRPPGLQSDGASNWAFYLLQTIQWNSRESLSYLVDIQADLSSSYTILIVSFAMRLLIFQSAGANINTKLFTRTGYIWSGNHYCYFFFIIFFFFFIVSLRACCPSQFVALPLGAIGKLCSAPGHAFSIGVATWEKYFRLCTPRKIWSLSAWRSFV